MIEKNANALASQFQFYYKKAGCGNVSATEDNRTRVACRDSGFVQQAFNTVRYALSDALMRAG
jgi:hypothetical protein